MKLGLTYRYIWRIASWKVNALERALKERKELVKNWNLLKPIDILFINSYIYIYEQLRNLTTHNLGLIGQEIDLISSLAVVH